MQVRLVIGKAGVDVPMDVAIDAALSARLFKAPLLHGYPALKSWVSVLFLQ